MPVSPGQLLQTEITLQKTRDKIKALTVKILERMKEKISYGEQEEHYLTSIQRRRRLDKFL